MESLKTELSKQADNAVTLATKALDTLKQTLAKMPESVKTTIVGLCKPLGTDLQLACGDGAAGIIANMTTAVGNICKAGVAAMINKANSTCTAAARRCWINGVLLHSQCHRESGSIEFWQASAAENLIGKAYSLCQTGAAPLPSDISKPILDGCKNATDTVQKIPREVKK